MSFAFKRFQAEAILSAELFDDVFKVFVIIFGDRFIILFGCDVIFEIVTYYLVEFILKQCLDFFREGYIILTRADGASLPLQRTT